MRATIRQNGLSLSQGGGPGPEKPAKRGDVKGWSPASARRNTQFLQSVNVSELPPFGYSLTLTVRFCPPTPDHWAMARNKFLKRIRREGFATIHWVTEWQARGVPHLHLAIFSNEPLNADLIAHWSQAASDYEPCRKGQDVKPLNGTDGWLQYLSKHASRGASNSQRQGMPEAWVKSGRLWGNCGPWPVVAGDVLYISPRAFSYARRWLLQYWYAGTRSAFNARFIQAKNSPFALVENNRQLARRAGCTFLSVARKMRKHGKGDAVGFGSWIPADDATMIISLAERYDSELDSPPQLEETLKQRLKRKFPDHKSEIKS